MPSRKRAWALVLLLAVVALVIGVRLRLLDVPLERDEGEYAYLGQLMLDGVPPYQAAFNMKLPGTYEAYALIMALFGQTAVGIHLGLLGVDLASIALLYFVGQRLLDKEGAAVAAATFGLLALSPQTFGQAAHATHFVVLAALAGLVALFQAQDSGRLVWYFSSGLFFGLSFLAKQPGLAFGLLGVILIWRTESRKDLPARKTLRAKTGLFGAGLVLPFALTCLALWQAGVFERFWFWTMTYASVHGKAMPPGWGAANFISYFRHLGADAYFWILAGVGFLGLIKDADEPERRFTIVGLFGFSLFAVVPGFYFSPHYFVMMLPALGLLTGSAAVRMRRVLESSKPAWTWMPGAAWVAGALWLTTAHEAIFFRLDPNRVAREIYGANPFPEAVEIGRYLETHSKPEDRVAILGSEPEICFYAHRRSASGYIYMYDLVQPQPYAAAMRLEFMSDVEREKPAYVVFVRIPFSWSWDPGTTPLLQWGEHYVQDQYRLCGVVTIEDKGADFYWDESVKMVTSWPEQFIAVYRRRQDLPAPRP